MNYAVSSATNQGKRDYQEDTLTVFNVGKFLIAAVFDGLGGHAGGKEASNLACEEFKRVFADFSELSEEEIGGRLLLIQLPFKDLNRDWKFRHAATTGTGFIIDTEKNTFRTWNIGDSSVLWYNTTEILNLILKHHEQNGYITSAFGSCFGGFDVSKEYFLLEGDVLIAMSDGVEYLGGTWDGVLHQLRESIKENTVAINLANTIVDKCVALNHKHQDNLTLITVRVA